MRFSNLILGILSSGATASILSTQGSRKALYFLDNNANGSSVIAMKISEKDGTLSDPKRNPTGGKGLSGTVFGSAPPADEIFSSSCVFTSGNYLFTVNCGSSTISMFEISEHDPTSLTLIGEPAPMHGSFPNSVTYSPKLKMACAVATGPDAGVTCFDVDPRKGLSVKGGAYSLPINQTQQPAGLGNTASQVVFNPSETALFVLIKNTTTVDHSRIWALPVNAEAQTLDHQRAVVSEFDTFELAYSLTFLSENRGVMADGGPTSHGGALVDISSDLKVTISKQIDIPNDQISCWTAYSPAFNSIFISDGLDPHPTVVDPESGNVRYQLDASPGNIAVVDMALTQDYLYVLEFQPAVGVYNLKGSSDGISGKPSLVQTFNLTSLGSRDGWQGMAVFSPTC